MIYHLAEAFDPEASTLLRLFYKYISSRAGFAFLISFGLVLFLIPRSTSLFTRWGWTNRQRSYMIDSSSKEGTPVMGGIHIFIAATLSILLFCNLEDRFTQIALAASFCFFPLGLIDDLMKIKAGNHDVGISRGGKYVVQLGFGFGLGLLMLSPWSPHPEMLRETLSIPFIKTPIQISWLQVLFVPFAITFITNAVNFADGMDGLATGPSFLTFFGLGIFAYMLGNAIWSKHFLFFYFENKGVIHIQSSEVVVICFALMGALLGFLWYNTYPATVFMGDCGSMYLGGLMGTLFVLLKQELLFPLLGFLFILEIGSVIIQDWIGIQLIGRRIFFRAPLHENLKFKGYSEPKIVVRLWILSGVAIACSLLTIKMR